MVLASDKKHLLALPCVAKQVWNVLEKLSLKLLIAWLAKLSAKKASNEYITVTPSVARVLMLEIKVHLQKYTAYCPA